MKVEEVEIEFVNGFGLAVVVVVLREMMFLSCELLMKNEWKEWK